MVLMNGSTINIPHTTGAFILSCGCGSGKTTMYKEYISNHWNEGILYTVDSRKECMAMYDFIINKIVGTGKLLESDVFMMFTKDTNTQVEIMAENNLNSYKQDPEILFSKKIVIIPHPRLFSDIPSYFLIYNKNLKDYHFDGDFSKLMTRGDLRKWILFDETPQFFKPLIKLDGWFPDYMEGLDLKGIEKKYKRMSGMDYDPFDNSTKLGRLKRDLAFKMLPTLIPLWLSEEAKDSYKIQFYPKDLQQPGMKTHLFLAEGAGDVLFGSGSNYQLIDNPDKYKSKLELKPFPFEFNRKKSPDEDQKQAFIKTLSGIINGETGRVLIVVWKDFKDSSEIDDSDEGANQSQWRDDVKDALVSIGIPQERFAITYYGASDTKSTNDYRDCSAIVCCGKWYLPESSSEKLNNGYGGMCDIEDYNLYQYVQLVSRIGVRNNTGETYRMYYSSDFQDNYGNFDLGQRLLEYINNNKLLNKSKTTSWQKVIENIPYGKRAISSIEKLISSGLMKSEMLTDEEKYDIDISLQELSNLLPHSKKPRQDDYDSLLKILCGCGITLNIK